MNFIEQFFTSFVLPSTRKRLGPFVSRRLMPSQNRGWEPDHIARLRENRIIDNVQVENVKIDLANGAQIDLCQYYAGHQDAYNTIIIHAQNEYSGYENHIAEYLQKAKDFPNTCIVGFNYRHVGASTGDYAHSEEDWIQDTLAVVNYYRQRGIQTENILLMGHSIGGAIATLAAKKDYEQNGRQHCLKTLSDRTFGDLVQLYAYKEMHSHPLRWGLISSILFGLLELVGSPFMAAAMTAAPLFFGSLATIIFLARYFNIDMINRNSIFAVCVTFATLLGALGLSFYLLSALALSPWVTAGLIAASFPLSAAVPFLRPLGESWTEIATFLILGPLFWLSFGIMDVKAAYSALPDNTKDHVMAKNDREVSKKASLHFTHFQRLEKERAPDEATRREIKDRKLSANNPNRDTHRLPLTYLHTHHTLRGDPNHPQINGETVVKNKTGRLLRI